MNQLTSIALSGLQSAQTHMAVAAHNVANLDTAGFKRQQVEQAAQPGGGVTSTVRSANVIGAALADDLVAQLQAKNAFLANLAVFKTQDQMAGALLDAHS